MKRSNDFFDMFYQSVANRPESIAVKYKSQKITYKELASAVFSLSKDLLRNIPANHNVPVLIYQNRGIGFIVSMLAVLNVGAYYIPIERSTPYERVQRICEQIKPRIVLVDDDTVRDELYFSCQLLKWNGVENCTDFIRINRGETDLAYIMFTSGSSGVPKGIKISYGNLCNLVFGFYDVLYYEFSSSINIGMISSFSFDASVKMIFPALAYGHTLVIAQENVRYFGRNIHHFHNENNILVCDGTPTHLSLMIAQKTDVFSMAEYFLIGGERLEYELLHSFCQLLKRTPTIINVYGPTECCVDVSYKRVREIDIKQQTGVVPVGKAMPNNDLEIRTKRGKLIRRKNEKGELWIRGKQVGCGYIDGEMRGFVFDKEKLTRAYRTGDVAFYNDNYEVVVLGRMDRQVKINGNRVELDEISSVIKQKEECAMATVELIQDGNRKILVAFIVVNSRGKLSERDLTNHVISKLPPYMIPRKYVFLNEIPFTKQGKIDHRCLERIYMLSKREGDFFGTQE